jgi:hypothetical protein
MKIVYESKEIALFKHRMLGLPNGRKIDPSIPPAILKNSRLMKYCVREILATHGLLGFYNASRNQPHKYARIQIEMTARRLHVVILQESFDRLEELRSLLPSWLQKRSEIPVLSIDGN